MEIFSCYMDDQAICYKQDVDCLAIYCKYNKYEVIISFNMDVELKANCYKNA